MQSLSEHCIITTHFAFVCNGRREMLNTEEDKTNLSFTKEFLSCWDELINFYSIHA